MEWQYTIPFRLKQEVRMLKSFVFMRLLIVKESQ